MASAGYPKISSKAWRTLRARAAAAPSISFTPSNVAALMGMASPESAQANIVRPLRKLGLTDDDGALTDRGNKWRLDASYGEACQEILDEIYPEELTLLWNAEGSPDLLKVRTWFDHKGFGESNAKQMAATYAMIASKDIPEPVVNEPTKAGTKKQSSATSTQAGTAKAPSAPNPKDAAAQTSTTPPPTPSAGGPNVHLDIQVHIPADASLEQIEAIFASMAKHLYKR